MSDIAKTAMPNGMIALGPPPCRPEAVARPYPDPRHPAHRCDRDMSYGVRQFLLTDPGGNVIRIGQPLDETDAPASDEPLPRLERALAAANLLLYPKEDPGTAARVIDDALAATPDASDRLRLQAWVIRADAAHALGDSDLAASLLDQIGRVALDPADRASLVDELSRAEELRSTLA